jgi:chemotaxis protein MotD
MTRVDAVVPQPSPGGGAGVGSGSRRLTDGSFGEADAGFLAQLAAIAGDEDTGSLVPRPGDAGEALPARWWQQQAAAASPVLQPDQGDGQVPDTAVALVDTSDTELPLPAVPPVESAADADVALQAGDDPRPQPQAEGPSAPVDITLPSTAGPHATAAPVATPAVPVAAPPRPLPVGPTDRQQATLPPESLPAVAKEPPAQTKPTVVTVVRTETHLAPAVSAVVTPPSGKPVPADRVGATESRKPDQPAEGAKLAPSKPAGQRGQAVEPLPMQGQGMRDQTRGDAFQSQPDTSGEGATPAVPLSARGITHAGQPSAVPAQQIADTIVANLPAAETDRARAAPPPAPRPAATQPVKVLTIQLQPADLGMVTVRLRLKADAVDVEVEAGRHATARLIEADRDTLTSQLRSAGYHVEGLTVRAVEPGSAAASPGPSPGSPDPGPQLQPGGGGPDARASGGRAQPGHHSDTQLPDRDDHGGEQAIGDRRGTGLYV